MPQARLPDINAAFTKHRNEVISSLKSSNYDNVFGALYALNALLPEEPKQEIHDPPEPGDGNPKYRVVISDIEFNKLTKPTVFCQCYHCDKEFDYNTVKVFDALLTKEQQITARQKFMKAWVCPDCKKICKLRPEDFSETAVKEPSFLGIVPKTPLRQHGLMDRSAYHRKVIQWAWTMLDELENKMALFRDDNWTKKDNYSSDDEVDEGLED
jgi:hypothetical protein